MGFLDSFMGPSAGALGRIPGAMGGGIGGFLGRNGRPAYETPISGAPPTPATASGGRCPTCGRPMAGGLTGKAIGDAVRSM